METARKAILTGCLISGVTPDAYEQNAHTRQGDVVAVRRVAFWILQRLEGWTLEKIAEAFNQHHENVLRAIRRVYELEVDTNAIKRNWKQEGHDLRRRPATIKMTLGVWKATA